MLSAKNSLKTNRTFASKTNKDYQKPAQFKFYLFLMLTSNFLSCTVNLLTFKKLYKRLKRAAKTFFQRKATSQVISFPCRPSPAPFLAFLATRRFPLPPISSPCELPRSWTASTRRWRTPKSCSSAESAPSCSRRGAKRRWSAWSGG